jgi:glycosyltransferase involved in cell wall biosynthesis
MKRIAFIINGEPNSAMGYRARALAKPLHDRFDIQLAYRSGNRVAALLRFVKFLAGARPQLTYVFDMSYSGVLAAWVHRSLFRNRLVIETGDAIYELMRSTGNRGRLGLGLTRWLENFSLRTADGIVVRSRKHQQLLEQRGVRSDVVQDGVDTAEFKPQDVADLRRQHGLDGALTIGLVGSSIWSEKLGMCYGWELIELLRLLPDAPGGATKRVIGVMIGDGSGIAHLKARCREYALEDRVRFLGRLPHEELPRYLNLIDICLSTQTNDAVGQVRTSGKLPEYLATGRYVLASEVGEAALVLPPQMLVPYEGVQDWEYPNKLAERVTAIMAQPEKLADGARNTGLAKEHFEYAKLAARLGDIIEKIVKDERRQKAGSDEQTRSDPPALAGGN